ncbi:MAG TPA: ABC transporter ATP-binding protein [Bryobacteraceae bacterium]|jgi:ABC-2 type transport system ATP-binding protein
MDSPIVTRKLSKKFRHSDAVHSLDLEVPLGSIYGLIGPNGAGKTTSIKLMMNILRPSSGVAEVLGVDSRRLSPRQFERIGYVSENQELPEEMTVEYFLRYLMPFYPTWDGALADELVRQFGLPANRRLAHLSRGMRMKAALASSLAYRPELLVLDEPFTGLDPLVRQEFIQGLLERAEGTTILISSHDVAEIESFASHVGYLENGQLQFAEEMNTLAGRFRQVEVVRETPGALPLKWPKTWWRPETAATTLRFVDSRFDSEGTPAEIKRLFPDARSLSFTPMPLKEIFVALAMAGKSGAGDMP